MSTAFNKSIPEIVSLRILMLRNGVTTDKLAEAIGISKRSLQNFYSTPHRSAPARCRIEKFFNCAIWSTRDDYEARKNLIPILKADPCLMKFRELQFAAKKHHVRRWTRVRGKEELIRLLAESLIAKRQKRKAKI